MKKSIAVLLITAASCLITFAGPPTEFGISSAAGQVNLSWPGDNLWLQSSCTLLPGSWVTVSNIPALKAGLSSVSLPILKSVQFFRLVQSQYLPPPTRLTLEPEEDSLGNTWFALWWDAVPLALTYNIYYAADPTVSKDNYASLLDGAVLTGITNAYVSVSNLIVGQTYYFVATAVSTSGESADSYRASGIFGPFGGVLGTVTAALIEGTNEFDQQLQGVTVTLSNVSQPQIVSQTTTDGNGNYAFSYQPAGTYQLCWSAPGFVGGCLPDLVDITNGLEDEDLGLTNDGSGLIFGHVSMADGSMAAQNDTFFGIQENVSVSLGSPGQPPLATVPVNSAGNYLIADLPLQSGLLLSASNGAIGTSTDVNVTGIEEVDLVLPDAPPVIVNLFATSNGVPVTQAPQGTTLQVTVVATNAGSGLYYSWVPGSDTTGFVSANSATVNWTLPESPGDQRFYVVVSDGMGGFATGRLDISTDLGLLFTGEVTDTNNVPIVGADVSVNGYVTTSDTNGYFSLLVADQSTNYTVQANYPGYVPFAEVFDASEEQDIQCIMTPDSPCILTNSTSDITLTDSIGSQLFIPSNSLATSNGPPLQPVCVSLTTLDPCSPASQFDVSTIGIVNGTNVDLQILAVADIEGTDASGAPLVWADGSILLNVAEDSCMDNESNSPPLLWVYDESAAAWRPSGSAAASTIPGGTSSFAAQPPKAGVVAVAKEDPKAAYLIKIDQTISVPINLRVVDQNGNIEVDRRTVGRANADPANTFIRTARVRMSKSEALDIQVISPKEGPEFYPAIPLERERTAIAQVQKAAKADPDTAITMSLSSQILTLTENRVNTPDEFLTMKFGAGNKEDAAAYYDLVDPTSAKTTFANWVKLNGFGTVTKGVPQFQDAKAFYFNACDLGFGRAMYYKTTTDADGKPDYAFYVQNYPSPDDASVDRGLIATVAMDYVPHPNTQARFATFYVFNNKGNRVNSADLDGRGEKFVPNLCLMCHGADYSLYTALNNKNKSGILDAHFIPFDLNSFTYSTQFGPLSMSRQLPNFATLNQATLQTGPSPYITTLVKGWYSQANTNEFFGTFVPPGWRNNNNTLQLYSSAFAVSCRSCHVVRNNDSQAFPNFTNLQKKSRTINDYVFNMKEEYVMPNAFRTFTIFWGSQGANNANVWFNKNVTRPPDQSLLLQSALGLPGAPLPRKAE